MSGHDLRTLQTLPVDSVWVQDRRPQPSPAIWGFVHSPQHRHDATHRDVHRCGLSTLSTPPTTMTNLPSHGKSPRQQSPDNRVGPRRGPTSG